MFPLVSSDISAVIVAKDVHVPNQLLAKQNIGRYKSAFVAWFFIPIVYCAFVTFLFSCTVTDFSAGALPIDVKFCTAVRPHLGQVFSHFGGGGNSPRNGRISGVNMRGIWREMLLAEALVIFTFATKTKMFIVFPPCYKSQPRFPRTSQLHKIRQKI